MSVLGLGGSRYVHRSVGMSLGIGNVHWDGYAQRGRGDGYVQSGVDIPGMPTLRKDLGPGISTPGGTRDQGPGISIP